MRVSQLTLWMEEPGGEKSVFLPLLRGPPAVNQNVGSCDKAGGLGAKVNRKLADLFHFAPAGERNFGDELPAEFRVLHQRRVHLRCKRPGADAVDSDFLGRQLQRESAGEAEQ